MRKFIKEKISIIIPTFNEENNIVILIDKIISEMTDKNYEIIIVDDGSTDLTVNNILEKFNKNELRVKKTKFVYSFIYYNSINFYKQNKLLQKFN